MITNKNLLNFVDNLSKDEEMLKTLFSYSTPKEMYKYASSQSSGLFSIEEFEEMLETVVKYSDKLNNTKLTEQDLNKISGGATDESTLRSIAMLANPLISLIINGSQIVMQWKETNRKISKEKENSELTKLLRKKQELETQLEIKALENQLNQN